MGALKKNIKDSFPSVEDVTSNPERWLTQGISGPAGFTASISQHAKSQQGKDKTKAAETAIYDAAHPAPNMPGRTETDLTAKRAAARRRSRGGRIDTVLSEGLG